MFKRLFFAASMSAACLAAAAEAETVSTRTGSDTFIAGDTITQNVGAAGDVFIAGQTTVPSGTIEGDLHVMGMDVSVTAATQEDVYAMGLTVVLQGTVGQDLTAMGMTVRTEAGADVAGNARLLGKTVVVDGAVTGALTATGQDVVLNAPVGGDARILAETLDFGPEASVAGTLTYLAESPITVPERVASADRVVFQKVTPSEAWEDIAELRELQDMPKLPGFATLFFGFIVSLLFFVVLGAFALGFMPDRLERLRQDAARQPGWAVLAGVAGLSILFGLVPIVGLTVIGLPMVPVALLAIVVAWTLGYALGAYAVAMRLWQGFGGSPDPGTLPRLVIFAAAITAIALLNFIPFVGWVANYTLVLLGLGAVTRALLPAPLGVRSSAAGTASGAPGADG